MDLPVKTEQNPIDVIFPPLPTADNIRKVSPGSGPGTSRIQFPELPETAGGTAPVTNKTTISIKDFFENEDLQNGFDYDRYAGISLPLNSGIQNYRMDERKLSGLIELNGIDELYRVQNAQTLAHAMGVSPDWAYKNQEAAIESYMGTQKSSKEMFHIIKGATESWGYTRQIAALGFDMVQNGFDEEKAAKITEIESQMPSYEELLTNAPRTFVARTLELMPQMAENFAVAGTAGAVAGIGVAILFNALVGAGSGGMGLTVSVPATGVAFGSAAAAGTAAMQVAGTTAGAMNAGKIEAGLAYADLIKSEGIDDTIARSAAAAIGILNGAIEISQMGDLIQSFGGKAFQNTLNRHVKKLIANGTYKRAIVNLAAREAAYIGPEVAQEVVQEIVNITFSNIGLHVNNRLYGTEFDLVDVKDAAAQIGKVAKDSAIGFLGMGFGPVVQTVREVQGRSSQARMVSEEEKTTLNQAGLPEEDLETITNPEPTEHAEAETPAAETVIDIDDIDQATGEVHGKVRADVIRTRMLDEEIEMLQSEIDVKTEQVERLLESEDDESPAVLKAQSELAEVTYEMDSLQGEKDILSELSQKQAWEMSADEKSYFDNLSKHLLNEHFQKKYGTEESTVRGNLTSAMIEAFPGYSEDEITAGIAIADARAESIGISTDEYLERTLAPEMFKFSELPEGKKASVEFLSDGKALIQLSEKADPTSWIHELGHISRRQITDAADIQVLNDYVGASAFDTWTPAQEEQFADAWESYLQTGKAPTQKLSTVFKRIKDLFSRIYNGLSGVKVPEEVEAVFDKLLSPGESLLDTAGIDSKPRGEPVLYQDIKNTSGENDSDFFEITDRSIQIPLEKIILREEVDPDRIRKAMTRLNASREGVGAKRAPIKVFPRGDGYFTVFDGNTTSAVLKAWGEESVIAEKINIRQFSDFTDIESAQKAAIDATEEFNELVDRLSKQTEAVQVKMRSEVKKLERAEEKVQEYVKEFGIPYGEATARVIDWNGASLIYNTGDDLYKALKTISENSQIVRIKDRIKNSVSGYRDILLNLRTESGHIVELQLHTKAMFKAKRTPLGHDLYKVIRILDKNIENTDEYTKTVYKQLRRFQDAFYDLIFETGNVSLLSSIASDSEIYIPISYMVSKNIDDGLNSTSLSPLILKYAKLASSNTYGQSSTSMNFGFSSSLIADKGSSLKSIIASTNIIIRKFEDIKNEKALPHHPDAEIVKIGDQYYNKHDEGFDWSEENINRLDEEVQHQLELFGKNQLNLFGDDPLSEDIHTEGNPVDGSRTENLQSGGMGKPTEGVHSGKDDELLRESADKTDTRNRDVNEEWKKSKRVDLTGSHINNTRELAELFSVYRNKNLEYFHLIYTDADNNIVAHNAITSGLPGRTFASEVLGNNDRLKYLVMHRMKRLGAEGYYILHNHPSGDPTPSSEDFGVTNNYELTIPGFEGHIIIDHDKFTVLKSGTIITDSYKPKKVYSPVEGEAMTSPFAIAKYAMRIMNDNRHVMILLNGRNQVLSWEPINKINSQYAYQKMKEYGASSVAVVTEDDTFYIQAIEANRDAETITPERDVIIDVIKVTKSGMESALESNMINYPPQWQTAQIKKIKSGFVFEPEAEYGSAALQKQYEDFIKKAVEEGKPVPENVLQQFTGEPWADEAIMNIERSDKEKQLLAFPWLATEARKFKLADEFAEYVKAMFFFSEDENEGDLRLSETLQDLTPEEEDRWYRDFWEAANNKTASRKNQDFINEVKSDEYIEALLRSVAADPDAGMGQGLHGSLWAGIRQMQAHGVVRSTTLERIRKILINNAEKYRKAFAYITNDPEVIQAIEAEEIEAAREAEKAVFEKELEALNPTRRLEIADLIQDEKLKKKILKGDLSIEQIEENNKALEKKLRESEKKISTLENSIHEDIRKFSRQEKYLDKINTQIKDQEKTIQKLNRELIKNEKLTDEEKAKKRKSRTDARASIELLKKKQKQQAAEIREKAREKVKLLREKDFERLKKHKEEHKQKAAELRAQKELREYKEKLLKKIMRPAGAKIQVEYRRVIDELQLPYRQLIEGIQKGLDPNFRAKKTMWRKQQSRQFFLRNPEANSALPKTLREKIFAKTANELSINELETLTDSVERLRAIGKKKQLLYDAELRTNRVASAFEATQEALRGGWLQDEHYLGGKDRDIQLKKSPWDVWQKMTLRPTRILQKIGGDKKGVLYRIFVDGVNLCTDNYLHESVRRRDAGFAKMKELGLKMPDFGKLVDSWDEIKRETRRGADGKVRVFERKIKHVVTLDDAIHYYIGIQNEKNRIALLSGNGIPAEVLQRNIENLTDAQKAWGEYLLDDFDNNFDRLKVAYESSTNQAIDQIEKYFPMSRLDLDQDFYGDRFAAELAHRQGLSRGYIGKGWSNERITIPDKYQAPIRTGATMVWMSQMEAQEHYIAFADQIKDMHYISGWRELQQAVRQQYGQIYNDWLKKYINDIAVPNIYKTNLELDRISRLLRNNTAIAYLAFNVTTMFKQLPSVTLYMADSGPGYLLSAAGQMAKNPAALIRFCTERDPQLANRAIDRALEELRIKDQESYRKLKSRLGTIGTSGIRLMDRVATAIGWKAVYDKNIQAEKSEAEAIRAAQEATLRTQPAGAAKDLAELYRSSEAWNWFTMFSNQLNQYWNMMTYDIPQAFRNKQTKHALADITSIAISAVVIAFISEGIPEDEEELKQLFLGGLIKQMINSIPLIGKNIISGYEGFFSTGADPIPMAESVGQIIKGIEGQRGAEYFIETALEGVAPLVGLPVLGLYKRPRRAIEERNLGALIGWYEKPNNLRRGSSKRRGRRRRAVKRRR